MRRDLTTSTNRQDAKAAKNVLFFVPWRSWRLGGVSLIDTAKLLGAMALGALLIALAYQIPVVHSVDIGGYDAAYVQGFYDPERGDSPALAGSDGTARWTRDVSYLLFPQAGLPAQITLRLRGRPGGPPPEVVVRLNPGLSRDEGGAPGAFRETPLARFRPGADWEEHTFAIDGGLLKPNDVVIEIDSPAAPLGADDPRPVGILLDRATYRTGPPPIMPFPAQLAYGALAGGMLYILTRNREPRIENREWRIAGSPSSILYLLSSILRSSFVMGLLVLFSLFLVLYRLQPPYPYPLRGLLPLVDGALAALLALRYGPAAARRAPGLLDGLALGGLGVWTAAIVLVGQGHVTLSTPGVENDFGVFARRSAQLIGSFQPSGEYSAAADGVLRADGFYNLGYPLLLWLLRPLTYDNPFLAARLISALSGALLLGATWWMARRLLGRGPALLALLALALSPLIVEYGLYVGTDMPFAALCTLALALLVGATTDDGRRTTDDNRRASLVLGRRSSVILAGLAAGAAFLMRHPGLLLLPFGWLAIATTDRRSPTNDGQNTLYARRSMFQVSRITFHGSRFTQHALFTLAFLIAAAPQLVVNTFDTGQPFYNQQAKNIWLCVYGSCDWGRWDEAPNNVSLSEIVMRDPGRVLANWWAHVRGFFGTGGEDTSEFGRAIQLRLLGFPANWLALGGLLAWLTLGLQRVRQGDKETGRQAEGEIVGVHVSLSPRLPVFLFLLLTWLAFYVLTVSAGISLPRFFLSLAPIYAIAAAWAITRLELRTDDRRPTTDDRRPTTDDRRPTDNTTRNTFHVSRFTFHVSRNAQLITALLLILLLWGGFATGTSYVLGNQPGDEAAAVRLVQATLRPGERLTVRVPPRVSIGKYSAIAHLVRADNGQYLLASSGPSPPGSTTVETIGQYTLYRIAP